MEAIALTNQMIAVMLLLVLTIVLFVSEVVRVDLAALLVMVLLGILSHLPGVGTLVETRLLFEGFSSNAVISIIAVMIIGAGLDKTGLLNGLASYILKFGGNSEKRIIPIVSGTVSVISSFMQNVGAAALFLPVVSRISARTKLPLNRLLMPMGFCAILGGTLTMVGSSPLILLNDLILSTNSVVSEEHQMKTFNLFAVTPIGLSLVVVGILYFVVFGKFLLPSKPTKEDASTPQSMKQYVKQLYGVEADIFEVIIPDNHPLYGEKFSDIMAAFKFYVVASYFEGQKWLSPSVDTEITTPCRIALLGDQSVIRDFCNVFNLDIDPEMTVFSSDFSMEKSGIAEIVIPPNSRLIGRCAREISLRKTHGLNLLAIHRGEDNLSYAEGDDIYSHQLGLIKFQAGDSLVVQTQWTSLARLMKNRDFVVVTTEFPQDEWRAKKVSWALLFFAISIGLILFSNLQLSLCLLIGASGMILTKVLSIDEAYHSVGWSTVFLLASLIPLGRAVQNTGAAEWITYQLLFVLDGWPVWALQAGIAILATFFTLIMSNVGATVLLVPLAVSLAIAVGANPAIFALTVAISTSNSFLIPTHQVNALILGPGGYRVIDFVRAGGIMTILFLVVSLTMLNLVF